MESDVVYVTNKATKLCEMQELLNIAQYDKDCWFLH